MESPPEFAELERQPTLFLVYTVHLDTQWRWTVQDTIRDFIPATLEGNFELFARHPARVLSFEGAFRYRLIEEYYPEAFERLRSAVADGNWRPAGSMLDSPDVNCVAPESLLRHILYATRYFESRFGSTSEDLFLPDCFGFGHALPTIAAHCGVRGFSAQKFGNWSGPNRLPFDIGRWLGPDGEGVVAAIRPEGYGEGLHEDLSRAERWARRIDRQFEASGLRIALMYVGLGDRGGRLGEDSLAWIERSVEGDGPIRVRQEASDTLCRALSSEQVARLPEHRGELLLPTHGTGCWTSQAAAKRWNRACERTADAAERACVLADRLGAMEYPEALLREAWERFLWHQMHDDLTGTSLPEAYRFTWNDQLISLNQFRMVLRDAVAGVAGQLDTRGPGASVAVFNPFERGRCDIVEVTLDWPGAPRQVEARGPSGETVPVQIVDRSAERLSVVFAPTLPALSVSIWTLQPASDPSPTSDLEISASTIANALYAVALDARGEIASVIDRRSGDELLAEPCRLEMLPDRSSRWPAWEIRAKDVAAAPRAVGGRARVSVVESGPVRAVLEVSRRHLGSSFRQRISLACGEAGRRIEIEQVVDWATRGRLLKVALRQNAASEEAVYGLGCGVIRRTVNTAGKYEVPGLWAAPDSGGLAILADGQAGWDHPDPRTLRLSLLRSPRVIRKFVHQGGQDRGRHRLLYSLTAHDGLEATEEQSVRRARAPWAWPVDSHEGDPGRSVSLLEVGSGAVVRALKRREDGAGYALRLQESGGRARDGLRVATPTPLQETGSLTGCEKPIHSATTARPAEGITVDLPPWSLRTVGLAAPTGRTAEPEHRHDALVVPWDTRVTSAQGERGVAPGGEGHSLPAELWPEEVRTGAALFRLGPRDGDNGLRCAGQAMHWTDEARRLHLLAATIDQRRRAEIRIGGRTVWLEVDRWDGIIGCWKGWRRGLGHRRWARPGTGFLRTDDIGWVATHLHDKEGRDLPYEYGHLFRYSIDLRPDERSLTLPRAPAILLFAATATR